MPVCNRDFLYSVFSHLHGPRLPRPCVESYTTYVRLLITADIHYNHPRSRKLADALIDEMNQAGGEGVLVVGDTGVGDGDAIEQALVRFTVPGPRLFVAGNHELWTNGPDSYRLYREELPRRVRAAGWHWLEDEPFVGEGFAIVGSVGWYDYTLAEPALGIPERFYAAKVSPGAAERLSEFRSLLADDGDLSAEAREVVARWNDGRFVKLHREDQAFLEELLDRLKGQLDALRHVPRVIAAIHHLPFAELLPPRHSAQWDFAKAYLGSRRIGELLLRYPNVQQIYCGHSHFAAEATIGHIRAINIGSGYRVKRYEVLELGD